MPRFYEACALVSRCYLALLPLEARSANDNIPGRKWCRTKRFRRTLLVFPDISLLGETFPSGSLFCGGRKASALDRRPEERRNTRAQPLYPWMCLTMCVCVSLCACVSIIFFIWGIVWRSPRKRNMSTPIFATCLVSSITNQRSPLLSKKGKSVWETRLRLLQCRELPMPLLLPIWAELATHSLLRRKQSALYIYTNTATTKSERAYWQVLKPFRILPFALIGVLALTDDFDLIPD